MTVATDPRKTGITGGMTLLASSAAKVDLTGSVVETILATVTIPGGAMGMNGGLLIYTTWSMTNSANNKTPRIRLGGAAGAAYYAPTITTSLSVSAVTRIRNRGSAASQVGGASNALSSGLGSIAGGVATSTENTAANVDLVFSGQLALGTETLTLESYEVWLLP